MVLFDEFMLIVSSSRGVKTRSRLRSPSFTIVVSIFFSTILMWPPYNPYKALVYKNQHLPKSNTSAAISIRAAAV